MWEEYDDEEAGMICEENLSSAFAATLPEFTKILGYGGLFVHRGEENATTQMEKKEREAAVLEKERDPTRVATTSDSPTDPLGLPGVCALSGHPATSAAGETTACGVKRSAPILPDPPPPPKKKVSIEPPSKVYRPKMDAQYCDPEIGENMLEKMEWIFGNFGKSLDQPKK